MRVSSTLTTKHCKLCRDNARSQALQALQGQCSLPGTASSVLITTAGIMLTPRHCKLCADNNSRDNAHPQPLQAPC